MRIRRKFIPSGFYGGLRFCAARRGIDGSFATSFSHDQPSSESLVVKQSAVFDKYTRHEEMTRFFVIASILMKNSYNLLLRQILGKLFKEVAIAS